MSTANRGFGSMDRNKQRAIASQGGKASHLQGTAHHWTSETARAAAYKSVEKRKKRKLEALRTEMKTRGLL